LKIYCVIYLKENIKFIVLYASYLTINRACSSGGGGINGLTPSEIFLQTFNRSHNRNNTKRKSVTYMANWKCQLSM